jgi:UDP-N-acetylmuramyl tripeptide synthase
MAHQSMSAFETTPQQDHAIRERNQARARRSAWKAGITPGLGKFVRHLAQIRGGGSSFPGMVVEKFDPGFLSRTIAQMPLGALIVSGTNGKTTTTRMIASLLSSLGLRVFTNPTGANFVRGVISSLIPKVSASGKIDADIAVLELDEAYSVKFVQQVRPQFCVLLNVMRDQLDRFGEIDTTARLLSHAAAATTGTVVLNREDQLISSLSQIVSSPARVRYFGLANDRLRALFPNDDDIHVSDTALLQRHRDDSALPNADVMLAGVHTGSADFQIDGVQRSTPVRLSGVYNLFNAAAALTAVRAVAQRAGQLASDTAEDSDAFGLSDAQKKRLNQCARAAEDDDVLLHALSTVTPAFGRGETIHVHHTAADGSSVDVPVEMVLVKNPGGFRLALRSFDPHNTDTMIAINDRDADGRDMSWLWDVDFSSLRDQSVTEVSGIRCWDMALRLGYDRIHIGDVRQDLSDALQHFLETNPEKPKRIFCTYTAMLALRHDLARSGHADVPDVGVGA